MVKHLVGFTLFLSYQLSNIWGQATEKLVDVQTLHTQTHTLKSLQGDGFLFFNADGNQYILTPSLSQVKLLYLGEEGQLKDSVLYKTSHYTGGRSIPFRIWAVLFLKNSPRILELMEPDLLIPSPQGFHVLSSQEAYFFDKEWNFIKYGTLKLPAPPDKNIEFNLLSFACNPHHATQEDMIYLPIEQGPYLVYGDTQVYLIPYHQKPNRRKTDVKLQPLGLISVPVPASASRNQMGLYWCHASLPDGRIIVGFAQTYEMQVLNAHDPGTVQAVGHRGQADTDDPTPFINDLKPSFLTEQAFWHLSHTTYHDIVVDSAQGLLFRSYSTGLPNISIDTLAKDPHRLDKLTFNRLHRLKPSYLQVYDAHTLQLLADIPVQPHLRLISAHEGTLYLDSGFDAEQQAVVVHQYWYQREP